MWYYRGMFSIDDKDIRRMEQDLKTFASRAYPFASKNTINQAAFTAQRISRESVKEDLTLRNRFTVQSIQVEQTRTLDVRRQAAVVGSVAPYMETVEFGGVKGKQGKEGTPIATSYAAGQGQNAQPRTRLPRKANTLQNIQLRRNQLKAKTRRQKNLVAVKDAAQSGRKFVFLELSRRKGIFRVTGGKRRPRLKMVWDLTRQSVIVPRNPWLAPAVKQTERAIPGIYQDSLRFQLKRNNLFRG